VSEFTQYTSKLGEAARRKARKQLEFEVMRLIASNYGSKAQAFAAAKKMVDQSMRAGKAAQN
jgi:hypothetical protein